MYYSPRNLPRSNDPLHIPLEQCRDGFLYWIQGRNADLGIYVERRKCFLVARYKFGSTFVDEENHWDVAGSAKPYKCVEFAPQLKANEMLQYLQDAYEKYSDQMDKWEKELYKPWLAKDIVENDPLYKPMTERIKENNDQRSV